MATNRPNLWVCACAIAGLAAAGSAAAREAASAQECRAATQQPAILKARNAVIKTPSDVAARVKLADAWSDAGCFADAVQVLQQGQAYAPESKELEARLKTARSNIVEQNYFDNMDRAEQAAKLSRDELRCTKLLDLNSCDEAITLKPNDPDLLTAQGDALVQLKRPGDAIEVYRRVAVQTRSDALNARLNAAEAQRQIFLGTCTTRSGDAGMQACQAAWLSGAPDEFAIYRRRGVLLQEQNQSSRALDAYIAAERKKPGDRAVALAIVSLSDSTGRKDAVTLAARGSALLSLGRPAEAIKPLRDALRLEPSFSDVRAQLASAVAQARLSDRRVVAKAVLPRKPEAPRFSNESPVTRTN